MSGIVFSGTAAAFALSRMQASGRAGAVGSVLWKQIA
jgi:hypothetical protein